MMKAILISTILLLGSILTAAQTETVFFGVNLAGGEFGSNFPGTYGVDYTYPSTKILDYYSSKGLRLIRLPIRWERIQPNLGGSLNQSELNRIESFISNANERNLLVIIDMHNYGRRTVDGKSHIIGSQIVSLTHIKDVWFQLANALKKHANIWGYGLMNEPHDMLPSPSWYTISQEIIDTIRMTDISTKIIVSGDRWSSADKWVKYSDNLKNLIDSSKKLVFEAHVYFDSDASGTYSKTYDLDGADPTIGVKRVTPFVNWLKTNNLNGFIGEYGIPKNDSRWLPVLDNFLKFIQLNNINGTYWAGGAWWGDYSLSLEPKSGVDAPQMSIVQNYLSFNMNGTSSVGSNRDNLSHLHYKVYPTIVNDFIIVEKQDAYDNLNSSYIIYNILGRQIMTGEFTDKITTIDFKNYKQGIYLLQFQADKTQTFKFFKK